MQIKTKFRVMQLLGTAVSTISLVSCSTVNFTKPSAITEVVVKSQVQWQHLNPARGDKAPQAATLWGDRGSNVATGFLLKPKNGFESPAHIHNVSYRGIVIRGLIHNDDPNAKKMWMPSGSYWTQPKGESHITASLSTDTLAYIEIEQGPYLVQPEKQAFDSGERPVNVDPSNLVWLNSKGVNWLPNSDGVETSYLWGQLTEGQINGRFVKLKPNFSGWLTTNSSEFRVVVIQGLLDFNQGRKEIVLEPGSYFSSSAKASHSVINYGPQDVVLYVRTRGNFIIESGR